MYRRRVTPAQKFQLICCAIGLTVLLLVVLTSRSVPRVPDGADDAASGQVFYEWALSAPGGEISPPTGGGSAFIHGGRAPAGGGAAASHLGGLIAAGLGDHLWPPGDGVTLIDHVSPSPPAEPPAAPQTEPVDSGVNRPPRPMPPPDEGREDHSPAEQKTPAGDEASPGKQTDDAQDRSKADPPPAEYGVVEKVPLPVCGEVAVPFGWTECPTLDEWIFHPGIDIEAEEGSVVCAPVAGEVLEVRDEPDMGTSVTVAAGGLQFIHSALAVAAVAPGGAVQRGETLGEVGPAPPREVAVGPHLHWEVRDAGGEPVEIRVEPEGDRARLIR